MKVLKIMLLSIVVGLLFNLIVNLVLVYYVNVEYYFKVIV